MPMANKMTSLVNKIERRLGTKPLNLPEDMSKDVWAKDVICNDTLDTFSRFFPNKIPYILGPENRYRNDPNMYLIDETICSSVEILGAGDIRWHDFSNKFSGLMYSGTNAFDMYSAGNLNLETIADVQMMADNVSVMSNGIYIDFIPPNKIKLNLIISSAYFPNFQHIPIDLFIKHADNLKTIPPTKMETFEKLAIADVATFLYQALKNYDQLSTVYADIDLKLSALEEESRRRPEIVDFLEQNYVSAANMNQPIMFTVN